jgi:hypothetical protein
MNTTTPEPARTPPVPKAQLGHFAALAGSIALLALAFVLVQWLPDQPAGWAAVQFVIGCAVCPALLLLAIRHGYLFARGWHWRRRKRREEEHVARLQIPAEVRKAEAFEPIGRIHAAEKAILSLIPDVQGQFRARALVTYAVPAVAVLLAGLQLALWPEGAFGAGLVLGQALLLFFLIVRVIIDRQPAQEWIEHRTRGELLRREQYLLLARVGPYEVGRLAGPDTRLAQIGAASQERMNELLRMEHEDDPDRATWLEHLASKPAAAPLFDDLIERVKTYLHHRAGKQIAWMRSAADDAERSATSIEWLAGIAAGGGILVAAAGAFRLMAAGQPGANDEVLRAGLALGTFLPALAGMLLALKSVFNLRFLAGNYRMTERSLERLHTELAELLEEVAKTPAGADSTQRCRLETRFQKLVLRVEGELTEEYFRWRIVTQRDAYELV